MIGNRSEGGRHGLMEYGHMKDLSMKLSFIELLLRVDHAGTRVRHSCRDHGWTKLSACPIKVLQHLLADVGRGCAD
jgi:hypothetical protein